MRDPVKTRAAQRRYEAHNPDRVTQWRRRQKARLAAAEAVCAAAVVLDRFWRTEDHQYELAEGIKGPLYEADHLNSCGGLQVFEECTEMCKAVREIRTHIAAWRAVRDGGGGV